MAREIGRMQDMDGNHIVISTDYDTVIVLAPNAQLTRSMAEEFARLFVAACWEAGVNAQRMSDLEAAQEPPEGTDG